MSKLVSPHGSGRLKPLLLEGPALRAELARARALPKIIMSSRERGDLIMLGIGGFTPLEGFMTHADWRSVCDDLKLANGLFWPIPITLSAAKAAADAIKLDTDIALVDEDGFIKITDRLSRFSKIAGEMVPHLKIEDALHALLGDTPAHVTAVPDEQRGERLVVLYTDASIAPADVWAQLSASELPALWVPKKDNIYVVDAIPTLGTGKTDLRKAKAMAAELAA